MSDKHIMEMPVDRFWLFSGCVDRMNASEDMRRVAAQTAINSQESQDKALDSYSDVIGTIVIKDYERDAESINRLKMLIK